MSNSDPTGLTDEFVEGGAGIGAEWMSDDEPTVADRAVGDVIHDLGGLMGEGVRDVTHLLGSGDSETIGADLHGVAGLRGLSELGDLKYVQSGLGGLKVSDLSHLGNIKDIPSGLGDLKDILNETPDEEGVPAADDATPAGNGPQFAVSGDGIVTVRGTEGAFKGADLQPTLNNLQAAMQDVGTLVNGGRDIARGPVAKGTLQPPGPLLPTPYSPPVPVGGVDFSTAIPVVVLSGAAAWMAAQYWFNVWFGGGG